MGGCHPPPRGLLELAKTGGRTTRTYYCSRKTRRPGYRPCVRLRTMRPCQLRHQVGRNAVAELTQDGELRAGWVVGFLFHPCRVAGLNATIRPSNVQPCGTVLIFFLIWGVIAICRGGNPLRPANACLLDCTPDGADVGPQAGRRSERDMAQSVDHLGHLIINGS
jgi:hypothetical protein